MIDDIMDEIGNTFEAEFDYSLEAGYLRECSENMSKLTTADPSKKVVIPLPIDHLHPNLPHGVSTLCTRKLLACELVQGSPIKKRVRVMMEQFAAAEGITVDELKVIIRE